LDHTGERAPALGPAGQEAATTPRQ
jgi:hypothetical protein